MKEPKPGHFYIFNHVRKGEVRGFLVSIDNAHESPENDDRWVTVCFNDHGHNTTTERGYDDRYRLSLTENWRLND